MISETSTSELIPIPSTSVTAPRRISAFRRAFLPESETGRGLLTEDLVHSWMATDSSIFAEWFAKHQRNKDTHRRKSILSWLDTITDDLEYPLVIDPLILTEWWAKYLRNTYSHCGTETSPGLFEASSLPTEIRNPDIWNTVSEYLRVLIRNCDDEAFEDGVKGPFWRSLENFLWKYRAVAVEMLERYCFSEGSNTSKVGEILRCLGRVDDPSTHLFRLRLLTKCLYHPAASVRDASAVALAYLNDRNALDALRRAIAREPYEELRNDMRQVVQELET